MVRIFYRKTSIFPMEISFVRFGVAIFSMVLPLRQRYFPGKCVTNEKSYD